MAHHFSDKVAVVTGAASGIGRALVNELLAHGARVVATDIDGEALSRTAESLDRNDQLEAIVLDVTDPAATQGVVEEARSRHGRLDLMFNNAGIGVVGEIRDLSLEDWYRVLDVNLRGVIHGIAAAYPLMIEQGFGHILNTASGFGLIPGPGAAPYVASKHAVVGLTLALRQEAKPLGVRVSVLCPGFVQSNIYATSQYRKLDREDVLASIPVKMQPADECARDALRGVRKNQSVIITPGYVRMLWWMHRFSPGMVEMLSSTRTGHLRKRRRTVA